MKYQLRIDNGDLGAMWPHLDIEAEYPSYRLASIYIIIVDKELDNISSKQYNKFHIHFFEFA